MIQCLCKLTKSAVVGMIYAQIALVSLEVFGGGVMLAWKDCPE